MEIFHETDIALARAASDVLQGSNVMDIVSEEQTQSEEAELLDPSRGWRIVVQNDNSTAGINWVNTKLEELADARIPGLVGLDVSRTWLGDDKEPGTALTMAFVDRNSLMDFRNGQIRNDMVKQGEDYFVHGMVMGPARRIPVPSAVAN